ncbi:uncharacterized protein PV07_02003 [Cladophialophora immunda]|uniref:Uncharacterized protein n=1 Tax=Cladophialophora immunda TaxID=569365 RepID=A0A0D2CZ95_9EURO|nr:uncharacterized protein PV07_02003 [Cladophialophora immunda]KIW35300.1 hypothetical protein PV07_02003 [Cladophialophora immunda]
MALLRWLDDTKNPTLWIIAIYPLLIFLVGLLCHFKMIHLVRTLPLVPEEPAEKAEGTGCSTTEDTSFKEYDVESATSVNDITQNPNLLAESDPAVTGPETREPPPGDGDSMPANVEHETETVSRHNHSEFIKGVLLYCLQLLLAHRVGVLISRQAHETRRLTDILIGLLSMSAVTIMLLISPAYLGNARFLTLRGYRTSEKQTFLNDPSDPWASFYAVCILSLVVPWLRLLFGFYVWWSLGEKSGCQHSN